MSILWNSSPYSCRRFTKPSLMPKPSSFVALTPALVALRFSHRRRSTGVNATKEEGFGMSDGYANRRHEYGDEFFRIDMEASLLSALEKGKKGASA